MLRSLHTGVSGVRMHQVKMDVIGNNISNVNTIGFKQERANFHAVLGQQMTGQGLSTNGGATNANFVGLGVSLGSISQNWNQGALQYTNGATDLAINGDGFFLVNGDQGQRVTRAGNFLFNSEGVLVTSGGLRVQGWAFDGNGDYVPGGLQDITLDPSMMAPPKATDKVKIGGNLSTEATVGESTTPISTNIYDDQGRMHPVTISFTKTAENEWSYEVNYEGDAETPPFATTTGTLSFDSEGTLLTTDPLAIAWDPSYSGGGDISFDFGGLSQFAGSTTTTFRGQNGYGAGELLGYAVSGDGTLFLNFTNGQQLPTFQLAIANVNNPNGLEPVGGGLYSLSANAGELTIGRIGQESQATMVAGALEMSNVDLVSEFTDMIVTQRGYQASARIITTSDELLQEVVQLKR